MKGQKGTVPLSQCLSSLMQELLKVTDAKPAQQNLALLNLPSGDAAAAKALCRGEGSMVWTEENHFLQHLRSQLQHCSARGACHTLEGIIKLPDVLLPAQKLSGR